MKEHGLDHSTRHQVREGTIHERDGQSSKDSGDVVMEGSSTGDLFLQLSLELL